MLDPLISLAVAIENNPGVFAMLLGSGLSRSAGVLTGWELTLDLIRRVAMAADGVEIDDPERWWKTRTGTDPNYSSVLAQLAPTRTERRSILHSYFEPTDDERAHELKVSTPAHHAIARLIRSGYVRVIVTTNFDRLLESALEAEGIAPTVISTPDAARGAPPLAHSDCTVIKLHGDYRDTRLLNTQDELATYAAPFRRLLRQVFDEYGLLVVGWSGNWDTALRAALEAAPTRRYSTYWAARALRDDSDAARLIDLRSAVVVRIEGADQFFAQLSEKVSALADLQSDHPLAPKVAVATVKRYLVDSSARIRLHDLVAEETGRALERLQPTQLPAFDGGVIQPERLEARLKAYLAAVDTLGQITLTAGYWSSELQVDPFLAAISRIGRYDPPNTGPVPMAGTIQRFPGVALLYMAGIAAVAATSYAVLRRCLLEPDVHTRPDQEHQPPVDELYIGTALPSDVGHLLPGRKLEYTPGNNLLHDELRSNFREILPEDEQYSLLFDRFEVILALIHCDRRLQDGRNCWAPIGRFGWRRAIVATINAELDSQRDDWAPIQAGLFGGSYERARASLDCIVDILRNLWWH